MEFSESDQSTCESTPEEFTFPDFDDPQFQPSQIIPPTSTPIYGSIPPQPRPVPAQIAPASPPFQPPQFVYYYLAFNSFEQAQVISTQLSDLNGQFIAIPISIFRYIKFTQRKSIPFTGYLIYHH